MIRIEKGSWWENLLRQLVFSNGIMLVIWTIWLAFGYRPYYLLSFITTNILALIFWAAGEFGI